MGGSSRGRHLSATTAVTTLSVLGRTPTSTTVRMAGTGTPDIRPLTERERLVQRNRQLRALALRVKKYLLAPPPPEHDLSVRCDLIATIDRLTEE